MIHLDKNFERSSILNIYNCSCHITMWHSHVTFLMWHFSREQKWIFQVEFLSSTISAENDRKEFDRSTSIFVKFKWPKIRPQQKIWKTGLKSVRSLWELSAQNHFSLLIFDSQNTTKSYLKIIHKKYFGFFIFLKPEAQYVNFNSS